MKICGNDYYLGAYLERCGSSLIHMDEVFSVRPDTWTPETFPEASENEGSPRMDSFTISDRYEKLESNNIMSHEEVISSIFYSRYICSGQTNSSGSVFQEKGTRQWQVFSEQLYKNGFFEGMSDEEVLKTEQLLIQITSSVDTFHSCRSLSASPLKRVSDLIYADRERIDWNTYKDMSGNEWQLLLESSAAALRCFNEKYVPEEQQSEFSSLIDQFYQYNSSLLEGYQSPNERRVQHEILNDDSFPEEAADAEEETAAAGNGQILLPPDTEKDKTAYLDALKAYFGKIAMLQGGDATVTNGVSSAAKGEAADSRPETSGPEETEQQSDQLFSDISVLKKEFQNAGHRSYFAQDGGWERCMRQMEGYWKKLAADPEQA